MNDSDQILTSLEGRVLTITFNRIEKKNAFTQAMYARMADEMDSAADDPGVRVIVFTGTGGVFSSGNDVTNFLKRTGDVNQEPPSLRFLSRLPVFPKPMIAAVEGPAVGIGTTMLLHCDLVYADETARFILPFARLGICPEAASSLLLPRIAGLQRATEMLMLGEPFDAERAREAGIVNEVVPSDQLHQRVAERAAAVAALPPSAVRATKTLIRHETRQQTTEAMTREFELFAKQLASPEAGEAMNAFLEKREPDFDQFD
jgi:enoyl-CoA hydratase/carnithine racemase